jgi:hypothetical protein
LVSAGDSPQQYCSAALLDECNIFSFLIRSSILAGCTVVENYNVLAPSGRHANHKGLYLFGRIDQNQFNFLQMKIFPLTPSLSM